MSVVAPNFPKSCHELSPTATAAMDQLIYFALARARRRKARLVQRISEDGNAVYEEEDQVSTMTLLGYVNLKGSLIFSDLAVGVAIPIYTEVMNLNIGMSSEPSHSHGAALQQLLHIYRGSRSSAAHMPKQCAYCSSVGGRYFGLGACPRQGG